MDIAFTHTVTQQIQIENHFENLPGRGLSYKKLRNNFEIVSSRELKSFRCVYTEENYRCCPHVV